MDQKTLRDKILAVPYPIRDFIGSEKVVESIGGIVDALRLDPKQIHVIPTLILRIEIKDISPNQFVPELISQLKIDPQKAKAVANDIFKSVFEPIQKDLLTYGINSGAVTGSTTPATPVPAGTPIPVPIPAILHKESGFSPIKTDEKITAFFQKDKPTAPPPMPAKIQLGQMPAPNIPPPVSTRTVPETPRIVHYSQMKTLLTTTLPALVPGKTGPVSLSSMGGAKNSPAPTPAPAPFPGVRGAPPRPPQP